MARRYHGAPVRASFIAATVSLLAACGPDAVVEHPPAGTLDSIAWLQGTWRARGDDGEVTDEHWTPVSPTTWMGLNRTRADGETAHHELLRMEVRGDGVRYVAAPSGQSRTAFALVEASESEARFVNPGHDFPKWIRYRRAGRALTATIGGDDPDAAAATWAFERTGDAPALLELGGRYCRDGGTLRVELAPRADRAVEVFCAGFEGEEGAEVHLAVVERPCDGCALEPAACDIGGGPVRRVNGRAVSEDEGACLPPRLPALLLSTSDP